MTTRTRWIVGLLVALVIGLAVGLVIVAGDGSEGDDEPTITLQSESETTGTTETQAPPTTTQTVPDDGGVTPPSGGVAPDGSGGLGAE